MVIQPVVEIESDIYSFEPANNGAGPLWCHGSTIIVRTDDTVYVAGLETLPDQKPLHNCRWLLFQHQHDVWNLVYRDESGRTREPSPLGLLGNRELLVTCNPTLTLPGEYGGPAEPTVYRFDTQDIKGKYTRELPVWKDQPRFTEHSYRTVVADGGHNEVLYIQNVGMDIAHMSLLELGEKWSGVGHIRWPYAGEYQQPQFLRLCYPNVIMRDRAVHFLGVSDVVEPIEEWKRSKYEITGREWDYVFRRLFYACTPDIKDQPLGQWIEIANFDATAGHIQNNDIWLSLDGTAHLIWCETSTDARLRKQFFPNQNLVYSLKYLTIRNEKVQECQTLAQICDQEDGRRPQSARFHILSDGTLVVLASFVPNTPTSSQVAVYCLAEISAESTTLNWVDVPLFQPFSGTFLTNTVRGGSAPSDIIDVVGISPNKGHTVGYARIRVDSSR